MTKIKRRKKQKKENKGESAERWLAEAYLRRYLEDLKKEKEKGKDPPPFKPFLN